jgi:hypothetical protein
MILEIGNAQSGIDLAQARQYFLRLLSSSGDRIGCGYAERR